MENWISVKDAMPDFDTVTKVRVGRYVGEEWYHVPAYTSLTSDAFISENSAVILGATHWCKLSDTIPDPPPHIKYY